MEPCRHLREEHSSRGDSTCKVPVAEAGLECTRYREGASVAGAKLTKGKKEGDEVGNLIRIGEGIQ